MAPGVSKVVTEDTAIDHLTWGLTEGWAGLTKSSYRKLLDQDIIKKPGIDIYFLSELYIKDEEGGLGENKELCEKLSKMFKIPSFFWRRQFWNANGFCGNRYNPSNCDGDSQPASYSTYFRFLIKEVNVLKGKPITYTWQFLSFFSFWCMPTSLPVEPGVQPNAKAKQPIPGHLVFLCFDHTQKIRDVMCNAFKEVNNSTSRGDPFAIHAALVQALVQEYEKALWGFRHPIRNIEETRKKNLPVVEDEEAQEGSQEQKDVEQVQDPIPRVTRKQTGGLGFDRNKIQNEERREGRRALLHRYTLMHELGRHIIHTSEVFAVAIITLTTMLEDYEQFFRTKAALDLPDHAEMEMQLRPLVPSTIMFNKNFLLCLELRSKAFSERLHNEINLAYNSLATWDSHISTQILKESKDENKSFILIVSILTVLFLPGTFISSFFGMNFFNYDSGVMKTSHSIWIFFLSSSFFTIVGLGLFIRLYGWTKIKTMFKSLAGDKEISVISHGKFKSGFTKPKLRSQATQHLGN